MHHYNTPHETQKNIFFSGGSGLPYSVAKLRYFYDLYKITANRNFLYPYFSE